MPWHEEVIGRRTDVVTADSTSKCGIGIGLYKQPDSSAATTAAVAPTGVMLDVTMVISTNSSTNKHNSSSGQSAEQDIHVKAKVRLTNNMLKVSNLLRCFQHFAMLQLMPFGQAVHTIVTIIQFYDLTPCSVILLHLCWLFYVLLYSLMVYVL
jgi:hypothetical protein